MKRTGCVLMASALALALTSGCANNEQTGMLVGGGGGLLAGGLIGSALGGRTGALVGMAIGGLGGTLIGGAIGRDLDERDRQRAEQATRTALMSSRPQTVDWTSDHNTGNRGRVQVVAVQHQQTGGECRTVRETAYIKGQERVQNARYCQNGSGEWIPQT